MQDTTSTKDNSWIEAGDPFSGEPWTESEIQDMQAAQKQREQVRQRLVEVYSFAPLYQARAAKDPEYWNKFYVGRIR